MKKLLLSLFFSFCLALTMNAQSITITSIDTNPVVIDPVTGGTVTVHYQYTSVNADDLVYVALELQDDWTWVETTADGNNNPVAMGTDLTGSITLTIPNTATLTADLTGVENYKIKAELNSTSWTWIAGDYPATEIVLQSPTAGLDDINADGIVVYPNPVNDRLMIDSNRLNAQSIQISNILGKTVKIINDIRNLESIDVSNLSKGMYILTTDTNKQFKFLKY